MIVLFFSALLWVIAAALILVAHRRRNGTAEAGVREAGADFLHLLPRLAVGVIGAGFIAKAMPQDVIAGWFGPASGLGGISLASVAGAMTPGGPMVGFALGAAALKSGAGLAQVMAFTTAWSLYTIHRVLVWEIPTMPMRYVLLRLVVSIPLPFLIGGMTLLLIP